MKLCWKYYPCSGTDRQIPRTLWEDHGRSNRPRKELIYPGILLAQMPQSRYWLDQGNSKNDTLSATLSHASAKVSFPSFPQKRGVQHSVPSSQDNTYTWSPTGKTKRKDSWRATVAQTTVPMFACFALNSILCNRTLTPSKPMSVWNKVLTHGFLAIKQSEDLVKIWLNGSHTKMTTHWNSFSTFHFYYIY